MADDDLKNEIRSLIATQQQTNTLLERFVARREADSEAEKERRRAAAADREDDRAVGTGIRVLERYAESEIRKVTEQAKRTSTVLGTLEKTLNVYNKSIVGLGTGILKAVLVYKRMGIEQQRELKILQLKIRLEEDRIKLLKRKKKVDEREIELAEHRLAILKDQQGDLARGGGIDKFAAALDVFGRAINDAISSVRAMQQRFGLGAGQAAGLQLSNIGQSISSFTRAALGGATPGVTAEDIAAAQEAYQSQFGGVITSEAARGIAEEAKNLGVSAEAMMTARRVFMTNTLGDVRAATALQNRFVGEFAKKGLTAKEAMQAIAQNSELIARNGVRFADGFARALADSKRLGVEIGKVDQFADSIISNYEGFLEKSAELGAMGVGFDTSRLGEIAVTGDADAFQEEIRRQLKQIGPQLDRLSRPQQLTLMQLTGMRMEDMRRLAGVGGGGEALIPIEEQSKNFLERIVNMLEPFGLAMTTVAGLLTTANGLLFKISLNSTPGVGGVGGGMGMGALGKAGLGLSLMALGTSGVMYGRELSKQGKKGSGTLAGILGGAAAGAGLGLGLATLVSVLSGGTLALPAYAIAGLALAGGGLGGYSAYTAGDDVTSLAGYGERLLVTPDQIIALNNRDNIISYADDGHFGPDGVRKFPFGTYSAAMADASAVTNPGLQQISQRLAQQDYLASLRERQRLQSVFSRGLTYPDIGSPFRFTRASEPSPTDIAIWKAMDAASNMFDPVKMGMGGANKGLGSTVGMGNEAFGLTKNTVNVVSAGTYGAMQLANGVPGASYLENINNPSFVRNNANVAWQIGKAVASEQEQIQAAQRASPGFVGRMLRSVIPWLNRTKDASTFSEGFLGSASRVLDIANTWLKRGNAVLTTGQIGYDLYQGNTEDALITAQALAAGKASGRLVDVLGYGTATALAASGAAETATLVGAPVGVPSLGAAAAVRVGTPFVSALTEIVVTYYTKKLLQEQKLQREEDKRREEMGLPPIDRSIINQEQFIERMGMGGANKGLGSIKFHDGGIVGMGNTEVPAILQKGEAVFTEPQYQRVQELANFAMMAGAERATPPAQSTSNVFDTTRLEQTIAQVVDAVSNIQFNMDGNRMSRLMNTSTKIASRVAGIYQQNADVTNI